MGTNKTPLLQRCITPQLCATRRARDEKEGGQAIGRNEEVGEPGNQAETKEEEHIDKGGHPPWDRI